MLAGYVEGAATTTGLLPTGPAGITTVVGFPPGAITTAVVDDAAAAATAEDDADADDGELVLDAVDGDVVDGTDDADDIDTAEDEGFLARNVGGTPAEPGVITNILSPARKAA